MLAFREEEALEIGHEVIRKLNLEMRLFAAKQETERIIFYYTAGKRVNFKPFVAELYDIFQTEILLQPVEPRQKARLVGGVGKCGRILCCRRWGVCPKHDLTDGPVSEKYHGACGQCLCCLAFEQAGWKDRGGSETPPATPTTVTTDLDYPSPPAPTPVKAATALKTKPAKKRVRRLRI